MNLNEAIKTLKNNGYIVENSWAIKRRFNSIAELRKDLSKTAIACHENAQYDEYEQEPYYDEDAINEITDNQFIKWMAKQGYEDGFVVESYLNTELDEKTYDELARAWSEILYGEGLIGWNYKWDS